MEVTYFRLNNKPIKYDKLQNIIENNYNNYSTFKIRRVISQQPFYKGDFMYYKNNYGAKGLARLKKDKYYIDCLES